jgi:hypothetical protein
VLPAPRTRRLRWDRQCGLKKQHLKGAVRLLMNACQESGVAGIVADGVEKWVRADKCHVDAVAVERVLKRLEGMVEFVDAKIVDA